MLQVFCVQCSNVLQFFYNEPDLGEDFFCPCLQEAIIVTLFSQTDFLTWEGRDHLGKFPTQASAVMTKTIDFFSEAFRLEGRALC